MLQLSLLCLNCFIYARLYDAIKPGQTLPKDFTQAVIGLMKVGGEI